MSVRVLAHCYLQAAADRCLSAWVSLKVKHTATKVPGLAAAIVARVVCVGL